MSGKNNLPSGLGGAAAAFALGAVATGMWMAGAASLMVRRGLSQGAAWPLATAAVCAGALLSGWLFAFLQKKRGIVCGAVQGGLFAGVLLLASLADGAPSEWQLVRVVLAFGFGCGGGFLGMLCAERRRRRA